MAETSREECFFSCGLEAKLLIAGPERIQTIIKSSKQRNDNLHVRLSEQLATKENLQIYCHKTCVSTYTSKTHIKRHTQSLPSESMECEPPTKQRRRSNVALFDFEKHCLFCGTVCLKVTNKHPSRWRKVSQVRTVDRLGQKTFKDLILEVCNKRKDIWSDEVRVRVHGATTDLHAADAQYHQDCRKKFMHSAQVDYLTHQKHNRADIDAAFQNIITAINKDVTHVWNSVELFRLYESCGGIRLTRRCLVEALKVPFGDRLLVLSSPGVASLVILREACAFNIVEIPEENNNIQDIAKRIVIETEKPEKFIYKTRLNHDNVNENVSPTLLNLLSDLKLPRLPTSVVASIITSHLTKLPTLLQIAMSNYLKRKLYIEELHRFGITVTYDEFKRFKASAAAAAVTCNIPRVDLLSNACLIQSVGDNFDATICSQNGLKQTHSMALIMTQDMTNTSATDDYDRVIKKLHKDDLKDPVLPDLKVYRYKGQKKTSMPEDFSRRGVLSLKVLAHQVVSTRRAHALDFMFLKSIVTKEKTPEYNGFNTQVFRNAGCSLQPRTKVIYLPMIDMPPADHDTILTSMYEVKRITEEAGQKYTVFTNDQQLYKIAVEITWHNPTEFQYFIPRLGGMHMLMSFIGCVGTLMAESGLSEILQSAFASVPLMLRGKKFPQNMRALRMVAEEVLSELLVEADVNSYDEMISVLDTRANESRTTRLWVDSLIKPVIIMMQFVRAEREGDWPLHLSAATAMLPYFGAASHWNYFRYATVYIMKMTNMPMDLLNKFMKGEHVMRHQPGLWNGIWSDMMIETTAMRYGHGPAGVIGITLNQKALQRWALAHPISSQLEKDLLDMKDENQAKQITVHKEEREGKIKSDAEDRQKLRSKLCSSIPPLT